jgi:glyoxylase-like metal-dependent hydrolase (beta-lactamase superfamily II)
MKHRGFIIVYLLFLSLVAFPAYGQETPPGERLVEKITDHLYVIGGGYGNMGVFIGDNGVLVVDTKMASIADIINKEISKLSNKPVRFVINTHWHYDHVDGNENMGKAGAVIIAHENVRKRMTKEQYNEFFDERIPPAGKTALPTITFEKDMTMHFNDEEVYIYHPQAGHTDGDAVVYFRKANVIHVGDLFFNGTLPVADIYSGGSLNFLIEATNKILPMIDDSTIVIPGHGQLANKAALKEYIDMLTDIRDQMMQQIREGKTLEQILAFQPTKKYHNKLQKKGFPPKRFVELVYIDLTQKKDR